MEKIFTKPLYRILIAVFCTILWGTAYPMIKLGYQQMNIVNISDKLIFAGARYLIASLMVFIFLFFFKKEKMKLEKSKIGIVVIFGLVQTGLMYMFNYIGVANASATKTSVLTSLTAFLGVIFAPLVFKNERLTVQKVSGCIIGLIGIIIVNLNFLSGSFTFTGEGFIIIAMLLNTAAGFIGKVAGKGNAFGATAYQLFIGGAFLLIVGLVFGGAFHFDIKGILITIFLAFVSACAFALWTMLLVYNSPGKIMIFNLLIPITGALFSYIILGETEIFNPLYIASILLVSIGILQVNIDFKQVKK